VDLFKKEPFNKEEVYDRLMQPLVEQMAAIAEEHDLPIVYLAVQKIVDNGETYGFMSSVITYGFTAHMTPLQFLVSVLSQLPVDMQHEICDQVVLSIYRMHDEELARRN